MDDNILKMKFEAEQKRSRQIEQKLNADAKVRVPQAARQSVVEGGTVVIAEASAPVVRQTLQSLVSTLAEDPLQTVRATVVSVEPSVAADPAPVTAAVDLAESPEERARETRGHPAARLRGFERGSLRDAIILAEIIAKPVSKRNRGL